MKTAITTNYNTQSIMWQVIIAAIPAIGCQIWFFGYSLLFYLAIAISSGLALEALVLLWRHKPLRIPLTDGSTIITALLLCACLPPLMPWWLIVIGMAAAIVLAKQLYGGLGMNVFNPAMVGYVVLLIAFPQYTTIWIEPSFSQDISWLATAQTLFSGEASIDFDAMTGATPLDRLHTGQVAAMNFSPTSAWIIINVAWLIGGLLLCWRQIISWVIPTAMLLGLGLPALFSYSLWPADYAAPWLLLFSGATMVGAFFIATDPVSSPHTIWGQAIFAAGIGLLTYIIRHFGGYPEGIAFAVLLMNMAVPLINYYMKPKPYGQQ